MGCSKVRYTCLLENERDMKQDSCFKNIWKINICNVGTLTVETLQVVLENRTYSLTACLYLRLGSRWRTPWELQPGKGEHRKIHFSLNWIQESYWLTFQLVIIWAGLIFLLFTFYWCVVDLWASLVAQRVGNLVWSLVRSLGQEDLLEKAMATHSSILAWRIPWTEKPCGLESMRSQRVRHDWARTHSWFTMLC